MVILFHKHKINCTNNEQKSKNVVPVQVLAWEEDVGYNGKHDQTDAFLNHLELYEGEWASIAIITYAIGWNLTAVFQECDRPREDDNPN